jgi:hypothetical protein
LGLRARLDYCLIGHICRTPHLINATIIIIMQSANGNYEMDILFSRNDICTRAVWRIFGRNDRI